MNVLKKLVVCLVVVMLILSIAVLGGSAYVRKTYGIDVFKTAGQLKTLTAQPDESVLCPSAFGEDDFVGMKNAVDKKIPGLVNYEKGKGYNGYSVDFSSLVGKILIGSVSLTEKEVGALAQTVFFEQTQGKIKIGNKQVSVTIMQVDFSHIAANGSANFNVVAKLDLSPFKDDMKGFPYEYLKKYVPDDLYVSSTVRVDKGAGFSYTISHKSLTLNNLSAKDTEELFETLNAVIKIGSAEELNLNIGTVAVDALVGNEKTAGFAYSMRVIGAKEFKFEHVENVDRFTVS